MQKNSKSDFKIITSFVLFFVFATTSFAQEIAKDSVVLENQNFKRYEDLNVKPFFPGGMSEFYKFFARNFKLSEAALTANKNPKGKIAAKFFIEKDGTLSNFEVIRNDIGFGSGKEMIRVLKLSPKWNPGTEDGQPVRVMYSLPITIQVEK